MVNVSHNSNNRSTRFEIFFIICLLSHSFCNIRTDKLGLKSEFLRHKINCFGIKTLVNAYHNSDTHTCGDYLRNRNIHHCRKFISSYEFGKF